MRHALLIAAAVLPLGACQQGPQQTVVEKTWIRLGAVPGAPAAAYFTLLGGPEKDRLLRVSSEVTTKIELHESMATGGPSTSSGQAVMRMRPLDGVDIPAKGKVEFKPGGKHVMLYGLWSTIKPGQIVRLTFTFADGDELFADTPVQAASAADPK